MIRDITPEDDQAMGRVIQSCLIQESDREEFNDLYYNPENYQLSRIAMRTERDYWVYERKGEVAGGIGVQPLKTYEGVGEIIEFYVYPLYQGENIGQELMSHAIETSKEKYDKLYIETHNFYQTANHIFQKYGFEELEDPLTHIEEQGSEKWYLKEL